jgi:hypothetical protein
MYSSIASRVSMTQLALWTLVLAIEDLSWTWDTFRVLWEETWVFLPSTNSQYVSTTTQMYTSVLNGRCCLSSMLSPRPMRPPASKRDSPTTRNLANNGWRWPMVHRQMSIARVERSAREHAVKGKDRRKMATRTRHTPHRWPVDYGYFKFYISSVQFCISMKEFRLTSFEFT